MTRWIRTLWIMVPLAFAGCGARQYVREFSAEGTEAKAEFLKEEQVTAGNEANYAPELSPNGEFVLFVSERSGNKDIWEKRAIGGFFRQLTGHAADDFSPAMSPDGKRIAFITRRSDAAGNVMLAASSSSRFSFTSKLIDNNATEVALPDSEEMSPSWFPNSKKIIFTARRSGELTPRIMTVETNGVDPKPLFDWSGSSPMVSPDGSKVVFVRDGAIYLGSFDGKSQRMTKGGEVKDGQPRFSKDGSFVVFVRYSDDSNGDGQIDGKDFGAIWRLPVKRDDRTIEIGDLQLEPLTQADRPHYFPEERPPFLYFTMQNNGNLDIYRLPDEGPLRVSPKLDEALQQFEQAVTYHQKSFILHKARSFHCRSIGDNCGEVLLRELRWLVRERRPVEAKLVASQINAVFRPDSSYAKLSEVALIDQRADSFNLFDQKVELGSLQKEKLQQELQHLDSLVQSSSAEERPRIEGQALLVEAKILAAMRRFSDAGKTLEEIQTKYKAHRWLAAEGAYLSARLTPYLGDKSSWVESLGNVVVSYPDQEETIRQAAKSAVAAIDMQDPNRLEQLAGLRDRSKDLKFLAAEAHLAIAREYEKNGKMAVANNEYRQIVKLYTKDPDLQLLIAERLSYDLEKVNRGEEAEEMLQALYEEKKNATPEVRKRSLTLFQDHLVRRGEGMLRDREPGQAIKLYRRVLDTDSEHVAANRGMIDGAYSRKALDPLIPDMEVKASAADANARSIYAYGYALTYKIDGAKDDAEKMVWIDRCIEIIEKARESDGQILQIHQTLGWLYLQKDFYTRKAENQPGFSSSVNRRVGIVKEFFGVEKANYLEMSVDAYLLAYSLSQDGSVERANLDLNLGNAYFELHNYPKALEYFSKRIRMLTAIPLRDVRSEALIFRSAGRSAFYADELPFAEVLQKRAISVWEKVGSEIDIAYSLDALALTLREEKKYKEALSLYERLLKIQSGRGDKRNSTQTQVNLAYTLFLDGQFEKALASFNDAESGVEATKASGGEELKTDAVEGKEAIKVDIAGEGSAAKGLDEFLLRDLILTTRYQIYLNASHSNEASVQLERKLALLKSDVGGFNKVARNHDEELAITVNRRANQLFREGRLRQSAQDFQESAKLARGLCKDSKVNCRDEASNLLSHYRVQLLRARVGNVDKVEKEAILKGMSSPIDGSQSRAAGGSRLDLAFVRKLRQMRLALICTVVEQGGDSAAKVQPVSGCGEGPHLELAKADADYLKAELAKNDLAPEDAERMQATLRLFDNRNSPAEAATWTALAEAGRSKEALATLLEELQSRPHGLSIGERKLALDLVRRMAREAGNAERIDEVLRLYDEIRLIDVSSRVGIDNEKTKSTASNEPAGSYQRLYVLQSGPNEILVSSAAKYAIGRGTDLTLAAQDAFSRLGEDLKRSSGKKNNLYIVPLDHTAEIGLASLLSAQLSIQVSEAPSAMVIAEFDRRQRIAKTQMALIGFKERNQNDSSKETLATSVVSAARLTASSLESGDFAVISTSLLLNDSEVAVSSIGTVAKKAPEKFEQSAFLDLRKMKLDRTTVLAFRQVEREDPAGLELSEGWVGLSLLLFHGGAATIVIPCSHAMEWNDGVAEMLLKVSAAEFSALQRQQSNGVCRVRVIGNPGIHSSLEAAFALQSLDERVEKAEMAGEADQWAVATQLWREASFFATKANKIERLASIQKQGLQAALKGRSYQDALFFQGNLVGALEKQTDEEFLLNAKVDFAKISVKAEAYAQADRIFLEAIAKRKSQGNNEEVGKLYQFLAVSAQGQKKYEEASAYFVLSHDAFKEADEMVQAAGRILDAANVQKDALNDKQKALELYQKAEEELKSAGEAEEVHWSVSVDRSNTLVDLGRIKEAIDTFESLAKVVTRDKTKLKVRVLQGLSNAYFRAGMFQKSTAVNTSVLTVIKDIPDPEPKAIAEIDALNLQGYLQAKLGDPARAFQTFDSALTLAKQFGFKGKQAILLNNIGFWQRETGNVQSSVLVFNEALVLDRELKSKSGIAFDLRNLGMSQILLGQFDLAKENLEEALKLSKEARVVYNEAYSSFALGDLYLRRNDLPRADQFLQAATNLAESSALNDFYWRGLAALAKVRTMREQPEEAIQLYRKSISVIEGLRAGLQSESFRSGFQSDRGVQSVYQDLVSLLMRQNRAKEAWETSERSRARAFIDSIGSQDAKLSNSDAQKMLARVDTIRSELAAKSSATSADKSPALSSAESANLQKLQAELSAIENSEAFRQSGASQLAVVEAISVDELTKIIGSDTGLIEYMVTEEEVFIWVIKGGSIVGQRSPLKGKDLRALVDQNRELTSNFSSLDYNGKALAKGLIDPIKEQIKGIPNLIIVPHGVLHYLSMVALPFDKEFLIDHFNVEYLESASLAKFLSRSKSTKRLNEPRVVAFGNPSVGQDFDLPFAEKEVGAILRYFPKAKTMIGKSATKAALIAMGAQSDILHIASHGEFNELLPSESKLRLVSSQGLTGDLTVEDVLGLRLNADLVTLSACETGLGKISSGDEIVGLNRAFFLAGAHSVISSLWRISDVASAVAMKRFYRNLSEGDSVAVAMKKAQLLVRKYYPHPAYWASFRVLGAGN